MPRNSDFDYDYDYGYGYEKPEKAVGVLDRQKERIKRHEKMIDMLQTQIAMAQAKLDYEQHLREEHPALQDAWEKYQIILRTVS